MKINYQSLIKRLMIFLLQNRIAPAHMLENKIQILQKTTFIQGEIYKFLKGKDKVELKSQKSKNQIQNNLLTTSSQLNRLKD